jgi:galactokinase
VIAFVRSEAVDNVAQSICRRYSQYTGTPTRCFIVEAVSGAQQMNARHD